MVAVTDRCHACGARRGPSDEVCERCGERLPAPRSAVADPVRFERTPAGLAWGYRIPVIRNRYTWIKWGWVSLWAGVGLIVAATVGLVLLAPAHARDLAVLVSLALVLAFVATGFVVALGLFGAFGTGSAVQAWYSLDDQGVSLSGPAPESVEGLLLAVSGVQSARSTAETARALLPSNDGSARWDSVRRVQFDGPRHVISLRRRWHHPLRLYVSAEHFPEVAAFVRGHVSTTDLPDLAAKN